MNLEEARLQVKLQKLREEYKTATESWQKSFLKLQGNSVKLALAKIQKNGGELEKVKELQKNVSEIFGKK